MTAIDSKTASRLTLLGTSFFFAATGLSGPPDRIHGPIDDTQTLALKGNIKEEARPEKDRGTLDPSTMIHGVKLVLSLTHRQSEDLEKLLEAQRDPASADYRNWLSPEEYGERFGASENDLAILTSWLQSMGFTVEQRARARNWITFSGNAGQIAAAFHTELHRYEVDGTTHFANSTEPSVPMALAGIVGVIRGLDDFHPRPQRGTIAIHPDLNAANGSHYLAPADLATIYDIQLLYEGTWDGTGQTLVIAGQTDINMTDIRAFRTEFNLPPKDPQLVLAGADPGVSPDDQIEANLDLEWSGAVARNATIVYVYSPDVFESVQYAVDQNLAPVMSVSYGACEVGTSTSYRTLAQQANAQGITWVNASGDSGAAGCDAGERVATHSPSVTFPADIPEVTGVGGTEFNDAGGSWWSSTGGALSYIPEKAWNDTSPANGLAASGGGASSIYAKPWWQAGPGVPNDQARDVPDVSLSASGAHDPYVIYANGALMAIGGTSAASPSFAGILAILNQYLVANGELTKPGLGNLNPALYSLAAGTTGLFHDITQGNNIVPCATGVNGCVAGSYGYQAGPGYDLATGLGSVDAWNLVTKWTSLPPTTGTKLVLAANPATIAQSAATQLTATVSAASGTNTPAGSVVFSIGNTTLGSVTLSGSGASATAGLAVKGTALSAGSNTITATYSPTGAFSGSTATVVVTVTTPLVATSVSLTANPASIAQNGSTVLTATVKPASGNSAPTGTVAFAAGIVQLGTANLASSAGGGTATLNVKGASLTVGNNSIVASYAGGSGFSGSTSSPVMVTVTPPPLATTVTLSANPMTFSQSASTVLTATVKPASGSVQPAGSVLFTLGTLPLGTVNLAVSNAAATATLTLKGSNLAIGSNSITASYSGSPTMAGSTNSVTVTVIAPPVPVILTLVAAPATIASSATTVLTATVTAQTGSPAPTGSVTFTLPGSPLGSAPLTTSGSSGTATLTVKGSSLASGANTITATYAATGGFGGAAGSAVVNVVPPLVPTTITVTASPAAITQAATSKLSATVQATTGNNPPAGSVTFVTGQTTLGSAVLAKSGPNTAATATLTVKGASLAPGNNVITAIFAGSGFSGAIAQVTLSVNPQTSASR